MNSDHTDISKHQQATGYVGFNEMGELARKISHALEICRIAQQRLESLRDTQPPVMPVAPCARTGIDVAGDSTVALPDYSAEIIDFTAWKLVAAENA